ncbi:MAG: hypothetical protein AB8F95_12990, partial [Bacteroidia bacterium]
PMALALVFSNGKEYLPRDEAMREALISNITGSNSPFSTILGLKKVEERNKAEAEKATATTALNSLKDDIKDHLEMDFSEIALEDVGATLQSHFAGIAPDSIENPILASFVYGIQCIPVPEAIDESGTSEKRISQIPVSPTVAALSTPAGE